MIVIPKNLSRYFLLAAIMGVLFFSGSRGVLVAHADSIAFVTSTNSFDNNATSISYGFTTKSANNTLICAAFYLTSAQTGSTSTFDGNAMTLVGEATNGAQTESLFCYPNGVADNNSHTIAHAWSGLHVMRARAVEYSGVAQSGYLGTVATGTTSASSYTISLDASSSGKWAIASSGDAGCAQYTNAGNATQRIDNSTAGDGGGIYRHIIDSNGVATSTLTETAGGNLCGAYAGGVFSPAASVLYPSIGSLAQTKTDGTTINSGSSTLEGQVVLKALLTSSSSDALRLEIEVEPSSTSFTNIPTASSTATVTSTNTASATVSLSNAAYHWQARAVDAGNNATSSWQSFSAGTTDFVVNYNPPTVEISDGSVQALYHFNAQDLTDSSGNGRNGGQGATPFLFVTTSSAKLGAAAANDQNTGFFTASSSIMDLSGDFTIGMWIKPQASLSSGAYFFLRNTPSINNNTGITYAIACAAGKFEFVHNGVCEINPAYTFNTGTWYWILMERQGSHLDAYVNDSLVQSVTDSLTAQSSTDIRFNGEIGGSGTGNLYYDEVFFANKAITTSTRDQLWNSSSGAELCVTAGCGSVNISPNSLVQEHVDSTTLGTGSSTLDNSVIFGATINSSVTSTARLDVEWQPAGTAFTNTANASSGYVTTGHQATTSVPFSLNHSYHWQARAVDNTGGSSPWQSFESSTNAIDFRVWSLTNAASIFLNGTSSLTYSAASDTFAATDPFTIEFWYRSINPTSSIVDFVDTRSSTTQKGLLINRDKNTGIHFLLKCDTSTLEFHFASSTATNNNGTSYDTSSIWHYVAITKNTGTSTTNTFRLYFDSVWYPTFGSVESSGPISGNCFTSSSTDSIRLGNDATVTSTLNSLTGNLDEVRIWNTERASSTITLFWNSEVLASPYLLGLWHFNNTSTESVHNATSVSSGIVSFVNSTPFGHFLYENNGNAPGLYASVTSTGSGRQMLWRYDGTQNYLPLVVSSTALWNALGSVTIASTTATSSMTLQILDEPNTSGTLWFGTNGLWVSNYGTSSYGNLYLVSSTIGGLGTVARQENVVLHELGHALGLDHSYWGNVMNYYLDLNYPVSTLQAQDISDYKFIWGGN